MIREEIIKDGLERRGGINRIYVNDQLAMIRRMFQWAVAQELIPVEVHQALATVEGLRKHRHARVTKRNKFCPLPTNMWRPC